MFKDLKIVELASVLAGPLVGTFFSELGATVIKIENKNTGGDVTRNWRLPSENPEDISAYYAAANFNKNVLMLDVKQKADYEKALEEIKTADIIIANFKSGDAEKLGLDFKSLQKHHENIIYGEITGYGQHIERAAFDVVLQAETGYMFMNGTPESGPIKMPVALIDVLAAHQLKEGLLCALIKKLKTGVGSYVTVSLFDAAMSSLANQATNWLMANHIPQALGTQHPNIAPYGDMFLTKDKKWVVLAVGSNAQFIKLLKTLNLLKYETDARFTENYERVKNRVLLNEILKEEMANYEAEAILESFLKVNIPAGIVKNMSEVFENTLTEKLIISEKIENTMTKKLKTVVFDLK